MRLSSPADSTFPRSYLLLAAAIVGLALLPAGCFRSRLLHSSESCPPGDPSCTPSGGKKDGAPDGKRDGALDGKRDGGGDGRLDGRRDGVRDTTGGGDLAGDARRDAGRDGSRDGRSDLRPDGLVCLASEICGNDIDDDCNGYKDCKDQACAKQPQCINRKQETCDNGIDDDDNGFVDCKDPACFGDEACFVPGTEICNNNLDDDDDGLVDCKDPDCVMDPICLGAPGNEICDNGKDDNGDGFADCSDPQCKTFPACLQADCVPDVDFGAIAATGANETRTISTAGAIANFTTCAPPGGTARVGSFSLATTTDMKLSFSQSSGAAHVVSVFRAGVGQACDQNLVDKCLDAGDKATAVKNYTGLSAGNYWVVVQSYPGAQGTTTITLSTGSPNTMEICNNGVDDDGDGALDCADLDCAAASSCNLCKPDYNLGTIVVGGESKSVSFDTSTSSNRYHPSVAGLSTGNDIVVQFSVRETVILELQTWQYGGDHSYGIFKLPPAGQSCDFEEESDASFGDLEERYYQRAELSFFAPGDHLIIFKANAAGAEGKLSITLSVFDNGGVELCDNEIDDDGDQLVDCKDPDCYGLAICAAPLCVADGDLGDLDVGTEVRVTADLSTATRVYRASCGVGDGLGLVYRMNLLQPMSLEFHCTQTGENILQISKQVSPLDACDEKENIRFCDRPSLGNMGCDYSVPGFQPGIHFLLVQGFSSGSEGKLSLALRAAAAGITEICNNGIDDDKDGATDCDDRKCVGDPSCANMRCQPEDELGVLPLDGSTLSAAVQTSGAGDDQQKTVCASGPGGEDEVIRFDLPGDTELLVEWAQVGNHALALYKADNLPLPCEANIPVDCHTTADATTGSYTLKLSAGKYYMVIDADQAGSEGGVIVQISGKPAS